MKAKTVVETVFANESSKNEIKSSHQLEYLLDFRGEESLEFINIGPIEPILIKKSSWLQI